MQRTSPIAAPEKKVLKRKHKDITPTDEIQTPEVEAEKAERKKPARKKKREAVEPIESVDDAITDFEARAALNAMMAPAQPIIERPFTSADTDKISENEYNRYQVPYRKDDAPKKKVAHAVIVGDTALQFAIPAGEKDETPIIRPLEGIEEFTDFGAPRLRAHTPNGTKMFASRFIDGEFDGEALRVASFSPAPAGKDKPFWGTDKEVPLLRMEMKEREKKELQKELAEIFSANKKANQERLGRDDTSLIKCGVELAIDPASVQIRDGIKTRIPDQNTVMGESAKDAYANFIEKYEDVLSDEMKAVLTRARDAHLHYEKGDKPEHSGQYRPEWGHAEGFSLTPTWVDPQRKDNLGAMPKWANTEMMIAERTIKWVVLNRPAAAAKIKAEFKMLLDSDLVDKIDYVATMEENGHTLQLHQKINPLKHWPVFPQPTDTMQTTAVAYSLLNDLPVVSKSGIKRVNGSKKVAVPGGLADRPVGAVEDAMDIDEKAEKEMVVEKPAPVVKPVAIKVVAAPVAKKPQVVEPAPQLVAKQEPVKVDYAKTVMQIFTTSQVGDYDAPWRGTRQSGCSGSGCVVERNGRKYILTNAHVVENGINVRVRFADDHDREYDTEVMRAAYQCDLALLDVLDPEFQEKAVAVVEGEMTVPEQTVRTVGFPMGGTEISISKGIVSRIEVRDYCMSSEDMLQVQVDAAVNSGNSGGPVFSNGRLVGIAFQAYDLHGLAYIIPMPIVDHFLTEMFNGKPYRGFPVLPVDLGALENQYLRASYGMQPGQSGVLVTRVDRLSDVANKLQKDDVLLEIEGLKISNVGTVDIPGIGKAIDMLHVQHSKYIGETLHFKVLRKINNIPTVIDVDVVMDVVPRDTTKVGVKEYDKLPTYFIHSGFSFEPVTLNYIEDSERSELESMVDKETGLPLSHISKEKPTDQYVVINDVLDCDATKGYMNHISALVKEINGKKIDNIFEAKAAMESNKEATHVIITGRGKIVVKNMSLEENARLLKRFSIRDACSDDMNGPAPVYAAPVVPTPAIVKPTPVHAKNTAAIMKKVAPVKPIELSDDGEILPGWDPSEESTVEMAKPVTKSVVKPAVRNGQLTLDQFTGVKKFSDTVSRIEKQSKLMEDLGFDDEEFDLEELGEGESEESSDDISEASMEEKAPPVRRLTNTRSSMFASKRKRDEDEEDKSRDNKRFRGEGRR